MISCPLTIKNHDLKILQASTDVSSVVSLTPRRAAPLRSEGSKYGFWAQATANSKRSNYLGGFMRLKGRQGENTWRTRVDTSKEICTTKSKDDTIILMLTPKSQTRQYIFVKYSENSRYFRIFCSLPTHQLNICLVKSNYLKDSIQSEQPKC